MTEKMSGEQHVHPSREEVAHLAQAAIPHARRAAIQRLRRELEGKRIREKVKIPLNTAGLVLNAIDAVTAERDAAYAAMNRAPHSPRCEARRWDVSIESWRPCTCWKSTLSATDLALSGQEGQG